MTKCVFTISYVLMLCRSSEGSDLTSVEEQVVKKLEQFNSVCDELYKEIVRLLLLAWSCLLTQMYRACLLCCA